jgi:hypothetical protein
MHVHDILRLGSGGFALILIGIAALGRRRSSHHGIRLALGVVQTALGTLLVICAGLLLRSALQVHALDPGASGDDVKIAVLALRTDRYGAQEQRRALFDSVIARLGHVPGIRVDDTGSALPLAGHAYFAVFFSVGNGSSTARPPNGQRFITWQADVDPDSLAKEVNHAVKTFDRGVHYWQIGEDAYMGRVTLVTFGGYGVLALILLYVGFRGERLSRGIAATAVGLAIGLGLSLTATRLLTGYLFGISVTDVTVFAASASIVLAVVLLACLFQGRPAPKDSSA